jgi:hypothetical protein
MAIRYWCHTFPLVNSEEPVSWADWGLSYLLGLCKASDLYGSIGEIWANSLTGVVFSALAKPPYEAVLHTFTKDKSCPNKFANVVCADVGYMHVPTLRHDAPLTDEELNAVMYQNARLHWTHGVPNIAITKYPAKGLSEEDVNNLIQWEEIWVPAMDDLIAFSKHPALADSVYKIGPKDVAVMPGNLCYYV